MWQPEHPESVKVDGVDIGVDKKIRQGLVRDTRIMRIQTTIGVGLSNPEDD